MAWQIELSALADKQFSKIDRHTQQKITRYLRENVAPLDNPRSRGDGLSANLAGLWRYCIGDYRVICEILEDRLVVLVVKLGHRKDIYG